MNLIDCNYKLNSTDVNLIYNNLLNNCKLVLNQIAPIKTINYSANDLPWYDTEIINKKKERDKAYKIFKISGADDDSRNYKKIRNEVVNLLKIKEQQFYFNEIDKHRVNAYLMWKTLKKLINPKNFNTNFNAGIQFEINGEIIHCKNELLIAGNFNNYFIGSIGEIVDSIDGQEYKARDDKYTDSYLDNFKLISLQETMPND